MRIGSILGWTALAALAHLVSFQTPMGVLRIELAFFLAYRCALMQTRPWVSVLTFAVPALIFDVLDNTNGGILAHLVVYLMVRRLRILSDFARFPASVVFALIFALVDRAVYGLLIGYRLGMGSGMVGSSIADPSYLLTVLLLPFGLAALKTFDRE